MPFSDLALAVIVHSDDDLQRSKNLDDLKENYSFFLSYDFDLWCDIGNIGEATKQLIKRNVNKKYEIIKLVHEACESLSDICIIIKGTVVAKNCIKKVYFSLEERYGDIVSYMEFETYRKQEALCIDFKKGGGESKQILSAHNGGTYQNQTKFKEGKMSECYNGVEKMKFDVLNLICQECKFFKKCEAEKNIKREVEKVAKETITKNKEEVAISISADDVKNYRNFVGAMKSIFKKYSESSLGRKRNGYKERMVAVRPLIKGVVKTKGIEKDEYLLGISDYVYFG